MFYTVHLKGLQWSSSRWSLKVLMYVALYLWMNHQFSESHSWLLPGKSSTVWPFCPKPVISTLLFSSMTLRQPLLGTNAVIIVFLDEVETTIVGHKCSDHLPILDQLNTITLSDGRVGLLSLNTSALGGGRREREREREGTFHVGSLTYCHVAYTFSSTIPFACEAPPNGFALRAVPRCFFL